jgi:peroxiredoxin Q/BCP
METLQIGQAAPAFSALDEHGKTIQLSDFSDKKLVIYFYPKDDTPGCTAQACSLRDNYDALLAAGFAVLGVSADEQKKHVKFITKYELPFPLLADTDQAVCNAYGVWGEKKFMGKTYNGITRTTFVIDEKGVIERIITKVDTANHAAQILEV